MVVNLYNIRLLCAYHGYGFWMEIVVTVETHVCFLFVYFNNIDYPFRDMSSLAMSLFPCSVVTVLTMVNHSFEILTCVFYWKEP